MKLWLRGNYVALALILALGIPGFTIWRESLIWINAQSYLALVLSILGVIAGARAEKAAKEQ